MFIKVIKKNVYIFIYILIQNIFRKIIIKSHLNEIKSLTVVKKKGANFLILRSYCFR